MRHASKVCSSLLFQSQSVSHLIFKQVFKARASICCGILVFSSSVSFAAGNELPLRGSVDIPLRGSVDIPLRGNERLQIRAHDVHLTWVQAPGAVLHVRGLSESQGVRRGDLLIFDLKEGGSKEDFANLSKKKEGVFRVEIQGPSMPLDLTLHDGQVNLNQLSHEIKVQMIQGSIKVSHSRGPLMLRLHRGQISVLDAAGKGQYDVYSGQVSLKQVEDSEVNLFTGSLDIQGIKGRLALNTQSTQSKVSAMEGTLTLDSQKGSLALTQFQGRLEGKTVEGLVTAQFQPETEVHLKSKSGRFNFTLPANSGAYLNLWTREGDLVVPKELSVSRSPSEKSARGRLRGESQKINITAHTSEGAVVIK